jgi:hypothetical protein
VTATVRIWQRVTVEEDAEGFGESCLPVVRRHLGPVRPEPPDVGESGIEDGASFEEVTTPEDGMRVAGGDTSAKAGGPDHTPGPGCLVLAVFGAVFGAT